MLSSTIEGPIPSFWGSLEKRMQTQWLLVTIVLLLLTMSLSYFSKPLGLTTLDNVFYDRMLSTTMAMPASEDIVIIAINDDSIGILGYWPWRRAVHIKLLEQLAQAKVVGIDVLLSETNPAYPMDDHLLANAIQAHGRVVLPTMLSTHNDSVLNPLAVLQSAAAGTGYINIYPDHDGAIRSLRLHQTSANNHRYSHLIPSMLQVANRLPESQRLTSITNTDLLIPYTGPPGSYTTYPYYQVLNGSIPAAHFRNKYVLIGSWASGLGDTFPTPVSSEGQPMAGVEILANGLQASLTNRWISTLPPWLMALFSGIPVLLACLTLRRMSPRNSLLLTLSIAILILISGALIMYYTLLWLPVVASLIGVALVYPLWSWRSQESALQHIDHELHSLDREGRLLPTYDSQDYSSKKDASLPSRIIQLHQVLNQLRLAQRKRNETLHFLSHDMRAPQNAILALMQLQQHPNSALPESELIEHIERHAHRTLNLVDGFVKLAKAEAANINSNPLDLVALLAQCCDEFWAQSRQRHIGIHFTDHPEQAWIVGDASLLSRVWLNLIDNALKYSPDHTDVSCHLYQEKGYWVALVQDQGRGIPENELDTLFNAFTRLDETLPNNPSGAGLGLTFVKTVIDRHKGSISVASRPDGGSTFIIKLPVSDHLLQ